MARPAQIPALKPRIGLLLTQYQRTVVEQLAAASGQGISETVRRLIEEHARQDLRKDDGDGPKAA